MFIKEKEIKDNEVMFKISPVFTTEDLVTRCRKLVDDYFTFFKLESYQKNYDFRKYSLSPVRAGYIVTSINISDLEYYKSSFHIMVFRDGQIIVSFPENITSENKELFITRFERGIQYAL